MFCPTFSFKRDVFRTLTGTKEKHSVFRKVKTANRAIAVQSNHEECDRYIRTDHIGSANTKNALKILLVLSEDRLHWLSTKSDIVYINGKDHQSDYEIASEAKQMMRNLLAGH